MTEISQTLTKILEKIDAAGVDQRYLHHSALIQEIHALEDRGIHVPARLHELADELLSEVVEARFDNLPV